MSNAEPSPDPTLTAQQFRVMLLLCQELSAKEIAAQMNVNVKTVEYHKKGLFARLGVRNMVGIVKYAIRNGYYQE